MMHVKGRKIALFLDYDGTLSQIVDDPDKAVMTKKVNSSVTLASCSILGNTYIPHLVSMRRICILINQSVLLICINL